MPRVTLHLSALLADVVGAREMELAAPTPHAALIAACDDLPALRTHLFDSSGALRRHVLCFLNDRALRPPALETPLTEGDRLRIHQAVSGG